MTERRFDPRYRDRAIRMVRGVTIVGAGATVGLAGMFSAAAAVTFSGKTVSAHRPAPPVVPNATAPVQQPPPPPIVIEQVVHLPAASYYAGAPAAASVGGVAVPRPPSQVPLPALPPPPPPVCHSTPSVPC
jgi:hypothetical protein